jgi:hypothetical protein
MAAKSITGKMAEMAEMRRQFNQPIKLVTKMPLHTNVEKNMPSIPLRVGIVISPICDVKNFNFLKYKLGSRILISFIVLN